MNKVVCMISIILIGMLFVGCVNEEDATAGDILSLENKIDVHQQQINNKLDVIMSRQAEMISIQRGQIDSIQMLISEVRKNNESNTNIMKIEISIDRGGYGEVNSFDNVDDAIRFINTFR